jgi:hypothetical protein
MSIGREGGTIIGGGLAPLIATWLLAAGGRSPAGLRQGPPAGPSIRRSHSHAGWGFAVAGSARGFPAW